MRLYRLIKRPIVTEKTSNMSLEKNTYVFEVAPEATKVDIKNAILSLYGEKVDRVNIINTREKFKFGRKWGMTYRQRSFKKAYVTLKDPNAKIDYTIVK